MLKRVCIGEIRLLESTGVVTCQLLKYFLSKSKFKEVADKFWNQQGLEP